MYNVHFVQQLKKIKQMEERATDEDENFDEERTKAQILNPNEQKSI